MRLDLFDILLIVFVVWMLATDCGSSTRINANTCAEACAKTGQVMQSSTDVDCVCKGK